MYQRRFLLVYAVLALALIALVPITWKVASLPPVFHFAFPQGRDCYHETAPSSETMDGCILRYTNFTLLMAKESAIRAIWSRCVRPSESPSVYTCDLILLSPNGAGCQGLDVEYSYHENQTEVVNISTSKMYPSAGCPGVRPKG